MHGENCPEEDPGRLNKELNEERDETRKAESQEGIVVTKIESIDDDP